MPRPRTVRRVAVGVVALLVVAAVVMAAVAMSVVNTSQPVISGELKLAGLTGPVTVQRNERGVADIYADSPQDLFRAEGYVHAQDRFFEMDLRRHITAGRLSELIGEEGFETDKVIRTMGWRRVAEQELPLLDATTRQYLQAYADGVNAWIHSRSSTSKMSLEYTILGQSHPGYTVEDWTPVDSLSWLKGMAWDLRSDYSDELARAELAGRMSMKQIAEIYPAYPFDSHKPVLDAADWPTTGSSVTGASAVPEGLRAAPATAVPSAGHDTTGPATTKAYASARAAVDAIPELVGRGDGIGSNSWVVAGSKTTTGTPLIANDPHLATGIPGIWYQVGLHCRAKTTACPFELSGFSFSGVPGIVVGHNDKIAWGMTTMNADASDFYLEQIQGSTSLRDGTWVPVTVRTETIKVAGQADRTITVRATQHGPILSDVVAGVRTAGDNAPVAGTDAQGSYAVALAWTALTPGKTADTVFRLGSAQNFSDFRAAAKDFAVPSQNLIYADTDGHIGYQAPGLLPLRSSAFPGSPPGFWPAPGWSSTYDWKGWVPFDEMPWVYDPSAGFIVASNQAVTQSQTPFITSEWDYGFRSQQIRTLLGKAGKVSPQAMRDIQMDNHNLFAPTLIKALLAIRVDDPFTREGQNLLKDWDYTTPADDSSAAASAAYFNAVWANLLRLTFDDELPADLKASGDGRWKEAVTTLLGKTRSAWWDNKSTPGVTEGKDEILRQAMVAARLDLTKQLGKDPGEWQWGKLHQLTLEHKVLGADSYPSVVRWLFARGAYEMPGGTAIIDANAWDASQGYEVTAAPSMRMVVDLGNLDASTWVNQTGQSGHPNNDNYDDQIDAWRSGEQYAWPFSPAAVKKATEHELRLVPSSAG